MNNNYSVELHYLWCYAGFSTVRCIRIVGLANNEADAIYSVLGSFIAIASSVELCLPVGVSVKEYTPCADL